MYCCSKKPKIKKKLKNQSKEESNNPKKISKKKSKSLKFSNGKIISEDKSINKSVKAILSNKGQGLILKQYKIQDKNLDSICLGIVDLINETKTTFHHKNLTKYQVCQYKKKNLIIITEKHPMVFEEIPITKESHIKKFFKQILQAMSYLHSKKVYNINLKINNLLLDGNGIIKLRDYIGKPFFDIITGEADDGDREYGVENGVYEDVMSLIRVIRGLVYDRDVEIVSERDYISFMKYLENYKILKYVNFKVLLDHPFLEEGEISEVGTFYRKSKSKKDKDNIVNKFYSTVVGGKNKLRKKEFGEDSHNEYFSGNLSVYNKKKKYEDREVKRARNLESLQRKGEGILDNLVEDSSKEVLEDLDHEEEDLLNNLIPDSEDENLKSEINKKDKKTDFLKVSDEDDIKSYRNFSSKNKNSLDINEKNYILNNFKKQNNETDKSLHHSSKITKKKDYLNVFYKDDISADSENERKNFFKRIGTGEFKKVNIYNITEEDEESDKSKTDTEKINKNPRKSDFFKNKNFNKESNYHDSFESEEIKNFIKKKNKIYREKNLKKNVIEKKKNSKKIDFENSHKESYEYSLNDSIDDSEEELRRISIKDSEKIFSKYSKKNSQKRFTKKISEKSFGNNSTTISQKRFGNNREKNSDKQKNNYLKKNKEKRTSKYSKRISKKYDNKNFFEYDLEDYEKKKKNKKSFITKKGNLKNNYSKKRINKYLETKNNKNKDFLKKIKQNFQIKNIKNANSQEIYKKQNKKNYYNEEISQLINNYDQKKNKKKENSLTKHLDRRKYSTRKRRFTEKNYFNINKNYFSKMSKTEFIQNNIQKNIINNINIINPIRERDSSYMRKRSSNKFDNYGMDYNSRKAFRMRGTSLF